MMPLVLIAVIAGLPVLLALLFRVNSVLLFLAVAVGSLLQRSIGDSTELALAAFLKTAPVSLIADIGLLALPVVLTIFVLRKSAKGSQVLLQIVPLFATGVAFAALMVPLLPATTQAEIYMLSFGPAMRQSQDLVIAVAAVLNLLLAWRVFRHRENSKHDKH